MHIDSCEHRTKKVQGLSVGVLDLKVVGNIRALTLLEAVIRETVRKLEGDHV